MTLAEEIVARVEPVEQVRLVSSGTEATMSAIRLARGFTGRSLVVKFAGCYHGHVDSLLASAGSGVATFALPDSAGVPKEMAAETIVLPYNDLGAVEAAFAERGDEIAAVITEAAPGNMGVVPPAPGFTEGLRRITAAHGALLISDEVMTGFRCSAAGWFGLEGPYAAGAPDLFTFGKVMGGGFPAAAFGGRADVMAMLAPLGPVYQAEHCPVTPSPPPPASRRCAAARPRSTTGSAPSRTPSPRRWRRSCPAPASRTWSSAPAACSASSSATERSPTTTTPRPSTCRPSPRSSTPCSARGAPAAERVRVLVRRRGPRRRGRGRVVAAIPAAASSAAEAFATIEA